jgi:hypothetical protein
MKPWRCKPRNEGTIVSEAPRRGGAFLRSIASQPLSSGLSFQNPFQRLLMTGGVAKQLRDIFAT